jgi:ACS family tartrate transporter-like MFS transporter
MTAQAPDRADALLRKSAVRLIPLMMLMYIASFLDRVNVGFAAIHMNKALGFTPEIFGFGSGIFFFGYFLFEVPSNLIMEKAGARRWMCRIMLTWGALSMLTAFVQGPLSFYVVRFLLGLAEAGLYPGMILYLTYWFPASTRGRFIALFLGAVPLASVIGAPISGYILGIEHWMGLAGWQLVFVLEGIPSLLLGLAVLFYMPDKPADAPWLTDEEKAIVAARLAQELPGDVHSLRGMFADARVWLLMIPDFGIVLGLYGLGIWLPLMVKGMGYSNVETGFVVATPYLVATVAMFLWGASSDRSGERVWHVSIAALIGAAGLIATMLVTAHLPVILALCVSASGIYAALAVFWTLPPSFLGGTAAAGGLALINSVSNLGGFFGPYLMGWLKQETGTYDAGMGVFAGGLIIAAVAVVVIGRNLRHA